MRDPHVGTGRTLVVAVAGHVDAAAADIDEQAVRDLEPLDVVTAVEVRFARQHHSIPGQVREAAVADFDPRSERPAKARNGVGPRTVEAAEVAIHDPERIVLDHRLGRCDKALRVTQLLLGQAVERRARQVEMSAVFDPHHRLAAPAAVTQKRFLVEPGGGADHEVVANGNGGIVPVLAR